MLDCKHFDTTTKEGRKAQRTLLPILKDIKTTLANENIDVWCINRYSYRATLEDGKITFEILLPKATDAEHALAVEKIVDAIPNLAHVKRGLWYFNQICFGYDSLVEMGYVQNWSASGTDMRFEIFESQIF